MNKTQRWSRLTASQHGAFGLAQARAAGIDSSRLTREIRAGRLRRGLPGVYLVAGSPRTLTQRAHEVLQWAGRDAALSHTTSGRLLGLDVDRDHVLHVTSPRNLRPPDQSIEVHRGPALLGCDVSTVRGHRITTMPRTIIDLSTLLSEERLDIALDSAIRRGMLRSVFQGRFDQMAEYRRPGTATLRRLITEREAEQGLTGSAFERRLLRVLRSHGLPLPVCQYPVTDGMTAYIDFAYPEFSIAIEADGYRWHDGRAAFERDRARSSELASRGWRVLQVTWLQLKYRANEVIDRIQRALETPAIVALRS